MSDSSDTPVTPRIGENRPDQDALGWRVGTWSSFREGMLAALPTTEIPSGENEGSRPLASLTTREGDDPAITLLDAWACALDVLTFYQERLVNEGFLNTATETRSVAWLGRHVGHVRKPDRAASTWLAFTVRDDESVVEPVTVTEGSQVMSVPGQDELPQVFEVQSDLDCYAALNTLAPIQSRAFTIGRIDSYLGLSGSTVIARHLLLEGVNLRLENGDRIAIAKTGATSPMTTVNDYFATAITDVEEDATNGRTLVTLAGAVPSSLRTDPWPTTHKVYVYRDRARVFGHTAPVGIIDPATGSVTAFPTGVLTDRFDNLYHIVLANEHPGILAGQLIHFETTKSTATPGYLALWVEAAQLENRADADFAVSGPTTKVKTSATGTLTDWNDPRTIVAWIESEELTLADVPYTDPLTTTSPGPFGIEGGLPDELTAGRVLLFVSGDTVERATVASVDSIQGSITLTAALTGTFVANETTIYGNVVRATHGETTTETLGSGDGSVAHQQFVINGSPVLWVSPAEGEDPESTLEVSVGGVAWTASEDPRDAGPADRVYAEVLDPDDTPCVVFGDGVHGARVPTGVDNVVATYRRGTGSAGNVLAGTLTLPRTTPPGIATITNPVAASGGSAPETVAELRTSISERVARLDRLVTVEDVLAYARSYPGVGKAVVETAYGGSDELDGESVFVYLSILPDALTPLQADAQFLRTLQADIEAIAHEELVVEVMAAQWQYWAVTLTLVGDGSAAAADVESALVSAFDLENRQIGQPVTVAEILTAVREMEGILDVSVTSLRRAAASFAGTTVVLTPDLPAVQGRLECLGHTSTLGAQILVLDLLDSNVHIPLSVIPEPTT